MKKYPHRKYLYGYSFNLKFNYFPLPLPDPLGGLLPRPPPEGLPVRLGKLGLELPVLLIAIHLFLYL